VSGRTREVERSAALGREPVTPWPPRSTWRSSPGQPQSAGAQTLFGGAGGAPPVRVAPRDPADIRGNTLHYAKTLFGNTYGYIWWIPLHNFVLGDVWIALGAGPVGGMLLSFLLIAGLFVLYGFLRSVYEAETATGVATAHAAANLAAAQAAAPLNAASPRPFFAPQPAATQALLSAQQKPAPAATPAAAQAAAPRPVVGNRSLGIYHLPGCGWADKIARHNRVEFDSPAPAQGAGFRPCHVCKP
jgi:hypothetical protein